MAAELVAEAVATFKEQRGDEQEDARRVRHASRPRRTSRRWPKPWWRGTSVVGRHGGGTRGAPESRQSIARILTAQNLVTEADLMWGMAQEMGLEFVDLDTVGVDFVEAGMIPESTARHHNVLVIGSKDGVPVVAASNPTDVFAMDDLRTIMGRSFTVVVATRTQITAYIGKAFNSGSDAADMAMEASLGIDGTGSEPVSMTSRLSPRMRPSSAMSTCSSCRHSTSGPPTSTSSPPRPISASATGSTACSTTCRRLPGPSLRQ